MHTDKMFYNNEGLDLNVFCSSNPGTLIQCHILVTGTLVQLVQSEDVQGLMYHISLHTVMESALSEARCVGKFTGVGSYTLDAFVKSIPGQTNTEDIYILTE